MSSNGVEVTSLLANFTHQIVNAASIVEASNHGSAPVAAAPEPDASMAWYASPETASLAAKRKVDRQEQDGSQTQVILDSPRSSDSPLLGVDGYPVDDAPADYILASFDFKRSRLAEDVSVVQLTLPRATGK